MGGVGSGRYKVLSDFQREIRKRRHDKRWKDKNPEYMKLYMRGWRERNHEKSVVMSRETKARRKQRMIEDAFERALDKRDGFESPVKKNPNYKTDAFRAWNREKSKRYYAKNKERVKATAKKCYYKNLEKNRKRRREYAKNYYWKKKLGKQTLHTFVASSLMENN